MTNGLTKSHDVLGLKLIGLHGAKLGTVKETFVDLATGRIEYLIIETTGLLGGSGKFQPVPYAGVQYDPRDTSFHTALTKEAFKAAPSYDREQLANPAYGWGDQAGAYFRDVAPIDPPPTR